MATDGPLGEAERLLDGGNFGRARKLARARLKDPDEAVRKAAQAILDRSAVDPVIVWLAGACTLFFMAVIYFTVWHK